MSIHKMQKFPLDMLIFWGKSYNILYPFLENLITNITMLDVLKLISQMEPRYVVSAAVQSFTLTFSSISLFASTTAEISPVQARD